MQSIYDRAESIEKRYNLVNTDKHSTYTDWVKFKASREDFLKTQIQFRYAVENFGAVIAGVLSKMPKTSERMHVAENVAEEHGHNDLTNTHYTTFMQFLKSMNENDLNLNPEPSTSVIAFNRAVGDFVATHSYYEGAALVGMIELMYVDMSDFIAKTVHSREWDNLCEQKHYDVHAVLDIEHAKELFEVSEDMWNTNNDVIQHSIEEAMKLGAHYFVRLYDDLLKDFQHD